MYVCRYNYICVRTNNMCDTYECVPLPCVYCVFSYIVYCILYNVHNYIIPNHIGNHGNG